jgi:hypothetical protein
MFILGSAVVMAAIAWAIWCIVHLVEAANSGSVVYTLMWGFLLLATAVGGSSANK